MEENKNINEQEEKIFKDNKEEANVVGRQGVYNPGQFYFPLPITSKEDTVNNINTSRVTFYNQVATSDKTRKILLFSFLGIFLLIAVLLLVNPVLVNNLFTPLIVIFVVFLLVTYFITSSSKICLWMNIVIIILSTLILIAIAKLVLQISNYHIILKLI